MGKITMEQQKEKQIVLSILDNLAYIHQYFDTLAYYDEAEDIEVALHKVEKCFPDLCGGKK